MRPSSDSRFPQSYCWVLLRKLEMEYKDKVIYRKKQDSIDPCEGCFFFNEVSQECSLPENDTKPSGIYPCMGIDYNTGSTTEYIWVVVG
jgi:hypothetical protein